MKLSELAEKITFKHNDVFVDGSCFTNSYVENAIRISKSIKERKIFTLKNNNLNIKFIVVEKDLVDSDLIEDIYNKIKSNDIKISLGSYVDRMCKSINVSIYSLKKDGVF